MTTFIIIYLMMGLAFMMYTAILSKGFSFGVLAALVIWPYYGYLFIKGFIIGYKEETEEKNISENKEES